MMSQNIQYKEYLSSKWWLMVIATVISTIIASFYLYFGWQIYMLIVVGAIFNIGVNSHLVLLAGAFVKTPIDLSQAKGAFGNKQAFNVRTMLISLPKLLLPMGLYALGYYVYSPAPQITIPSNYHLTFSKSESNDSDVRSAIRNGLNVAVVFDKLPETYLGRPVVSGDESDIRINDPKNVIVGLLAKGPAKRDDSGFVVRTV